MTPWRNENGYYICGTWGGVCGVQRDIPVLAHSGLRKPWELTLRVSGFALLHLTVLSSPFEPPPSLPTRPFLLKPGTLAFPRAPIGEDLRILQKYFGSRHHLDGRNLPMDCTI